MSTTALDRLFKDTRFAALPPAVIDAGAGVLIFGLLVLVALWTAAPVAMTVDGVGETVQTHRRTVAKLLLDLGLNLDEKDRVAPEPGSPVQRQMAVIVNRARPVRIFADGRDLLVTTWGETPAEVLADAGLSMDSHDQALVDGEPVGWDDPLPTQEMSMAPRTYDLGHAWDLLDREPLQLRVHRSLPLNVTDGGLTFPVRTTAQTVGEALVQDGIILYLGDQVQPSLGTPVSAGMRIFIERSTPLSLVADGRTVRTRVKAETVADALSEMEVAVTGLDRVAPPLDTSLYDDVAIQITRVREEVEIEEEIAPFETIFEPDPNLPIDTQQVIAAGAEGITRTRSRVRYEDGQEVERVVEDTWVAQEPAQRIITYGQRIEPHTATMPDGTQITYWRKVKALATSYSASRAGVSPDNPHYGRTYSGEPMRDGVVAVDFSVVPLRSKLYIPGYGFGDALDTGGGIRGRHVDLGFADDTYRPVRRWVDVYLLWPPPPAYKITWVLPNWPRPPQ